MVFRLRRGEADTQLAHAVHVQVAESLKHESQLGLIDGLRIARLAA